MSCYEDTPLPSHEFPEYGISEFTEEEQAMMQKFLEQKLSFNEISFREGPAQTAFNLATVAYVATSAVIHEANRIFGEGGWSSSVISLQQDFLEELDGKFYCGCSALLRLTLKDGSFREDVGYGCIEGTTPALALSRSKKTAVSDGLKRCMRLFGSRLGNCLADKQFTEPLIEQHKAMESKRLCNQ